MRGVSLTTSNSRELAFDMYFIEDKESYIKRIQKLLGVSQTGRLDKRTLSAIMSVKNKYEIPDMPLIDYQTFLAIKDFARKAKFNASGALYRPYDVSEQMRGINGMIGILVSHYSLLCRMPKGPVYGYDTQRAVARLREIYTLEGDNMIDGELLYYIKKDISSLNANYKLKADG